MQYTFDELMHLAEREAGGVDAPTRPTIVKELLHYSILHALSRSQLRERVSFMGGTSLRLIYGGNRYSEDLDFVCGADAREPFDLAGMELLLQETVVERFGLGLEIKTPKPGPDREFGDGIAVKRWQFSILVPGFVAAQKINFEVCNVPAHDAAPRLVRPRYDFLGDVYGDIALHVESEREIHADKVVALIARDFMKSRDLWDLEWLRQRNVPLDIELVQRKLADYGVEDVRDRIEVSLGRLQAQDAHTKFVTEMVRFVTPSVGRSLTDPAFSRVYLQGAVDLLERVSPELVATPRP